MSLRVCLNLPHRGHSFRSYVKERVCVHAESWAPPAESARTASFAHSTANCFSTSIFGGVHLHQIIWYLFPFGRAVRSSQTRKRGETLLPLPINRYIVSLGLHWIYSFPVTNQHQSTRQILFYSVRSNALWGGLRHTLTRRNACWLLDTGPLQETRATAVYVDHAVYGSHTTTRAIVHHTQKSQQIRNIGV